ncbi:hydrogenase nickel incorporation protein HypA [Pseudovibrio axinellae]|uniref:Hydrogenase nickel incorporation protein HypA n=1 Tax=Pseudovibrio axinellae TaxID=989403 RepID=A0A161VAC1_9HYPH|nr:hydrogenase maturation nickel metallochaperone HypA [Pseudovibrio axinellae]KZL16269.1 hydrogenase nickel incorporation protein HypA [Pseudovibrio axinellae]SER78509.1 hydrogenase nickel incorporation protein HypA/HybF [Pseudovibrio axinellae]
MHELSLMADLMRKIKDLAKDANSDKIVGVSVKLGALSHITPEHFREHFESASIGTCAEGAELKMEECTDHNDPNAQDILLKSVEVVS